MIITPSIGQILGFKPHGKAQETWPAIVTAVRGMEVVVTYFMPGQAPVPVGHPIKLLQEGDDPAAPASFHCFFMPEQIEKARNTQLDPEAIRNAGYRELS